MKKPNILIIGEVILDFYSTGKVINYEQNSTAPVFISENQYLCLGGAGNVSANVSSAKMNAYICSIVNNAYKETIQKLFKETNVLTNLLLTDTKFPTSIKNRFSEKNNILFRVDEESIISTEMYSRLRKSLFNLVKENILQFDCIIISDYDKGLLDDNCVSEILSLGQQFNIPTIIDPAYNTINRYRNTTIIKLNKKELQHFSGTQIGNKKDLLMAAQYLLEEIACQIVIVTCSEEGILFLDRNGTSYFIENPKHLTAYVIGAGDTVTAYTAYCLLHRFPAEKFLKVLSVAGELAVKEPGTTHINVDCVLKVLSKEFPNDK